MSTAFHPQTNGQTERVNQEIEKYLQIFVNYRQDDWTDWLPLAEFAHNNRIHSATGKSPFMVLYGRNPCILPNASDYYSISNPAAEEFMTTMTDIHREMCDALEKAGIVTIFPYLISAPISSRRFAYLAYLKSPHIMRLSIQTPTKPST